MRRERGVGGADVEGWARGGSGSRCALSVGVPWVGGGVRVEWDGDTGGRGITFSFGKSASARDL